MGRRAHPGAATLVALAAALGGCARSQDAEPGRGVGADTSVAEQDTLDPGEDPGDAARGAADALVDDARDTAPAHVRDSGPPDAVVAQDSLGGDEGAQTMGDTQPADAAGWQPCPNAKKWGDGAGDVKNTCWGPPQKWCSHAMAGKDREACSQDGQSCCVFPTTCFPCDWVLCTAKCLYLGTCPEACGTQAKPGIVLGPWNGPGCDALQWRMVHCAVCGDELVCPEK